MCRHISNGIKTPLYDRITANKIVNVSPYWRFLISDPSVIGDGVREVKACVCKSLEYELTRARLILEEGTYSLYNPADSSNTLVRFIMELFPQIRLSYSLLSQDKGSRLLPGRQLSPNAGLREASPCCWNSVGQQEIHEHEALRGSFGRCLCRLTSFRTESANIFAHKS